MADLRIPEYRVFVSQPGPFSLDDGEDQPLTTGYYVVSVPSALTVTGPKELISRCSMLRLVGREFMVVIGPAVLATGVMFYTALTVSSVWGKSVPILHYLSFGAFMVTECAAILYVIKVLPKRIEAIHSRVTIT